MWTGAQGFLCREAHEALTRSYLFGALHQRVDRGFLKEMRTGPVLVVEDDRDIRENLQMILDLEGFPARGVSNGREALDYLIAGNPVSLILLDLMMPVMDGYEFMDVFYSKHAGFGGIPIIVLSAVPEVAKVAGSRGVSFVKKPIELDLLLGTISQKLAAGSDSSPAPSLQ